MVKMFDVGTVDDYYKKFHYAARYMREENKEILTVKMGKEEVKTMTRMLKLLKTYMESEGVDDGK